MQQSNNWFQYADSILEFELNDAIDDLPVSDNYRGYWRRQAIAAKTRALIIQDRVLNNIKIPETE